MKLCTSIIKLAGLKFFEKVHQKNFQKYLPKIFFKKLAKRSSKNLSKELSKNIQKIPKEYSIQKKHPKNRLKHHEIPLSLVWTFTFYLNPVRHTVYMNITNYVN